MKQQMGIVIEIPGRPRIVLSHLVVDFNGTLAKDGSLLPGVATRLQRLGRRIRIIVATADTFGNVRSALKGLPVIVEIVGTWRDKLRLLQQLGHSLVVAKTVTASLFDLPTDVQTEVWETVRRVREMLIRRFKPDGFNIGINDGPASGQTVAHAHVHIIPRYANDVPDPRGGIRRILAARARC
jgi:hypothetical protein